MKSNLFKISFLLALLTSGIVTSHRCPQILGKSALNVIDTPQAVWKYFQAQAALGVPDENGLDFKCEKCHPTVLWMSKNIEKRIGDLPRKEHAGFAADVRRQASHLLDPSQVSYRKFLNLALDFSILMSLPRKGIRPTEFSVWDKEPEVAHERGQRILNKFIWGLPNYFILPTEKKLNQWFFVRSRPFPVYYIGLATRNQTADGELMTPYRYFIHDLEHSLEMLAKDAVFYQPDPKYYSAAENRWMQESVSQRGSWIEKLEREVSSLGVSREAETVVSSLFDVLHEMGESFDPFRVLNYLSPGNCKFVDAYMNRRFSGPMSPVAFLEGRLFNKKPEYLEFLRDRPVASEVTAGMQTVVRFWENQLTPEARRNFCRRAG